MKKGVVLLVLFTTVFCCGMQEKKKFLFTVTNLKNGKRSIKLNGPVQFSVDPHSGKVLGPFNASELRKSKKCQDLLMQSQEEKDNKLKDVFWKDYSDDSCWHKKRKDLALCLAAGANPDSVQDELSCSILWSAICVDDVGAAFLALECGANPDIEQPASFSGEKIIDCSRSLAMAQLLYLCGAKPNSVYKSLAESKIDWRVLQFYLAQYPKSIYLKQLVLNFYEYSEDKLEQFLRKLKLLLDVGIKDEYDEAVECLLSGEGCDSGLRSDKQKMCGTIAVKMIKNPQPPIHYWLHKIEHRNRSRQQLKAQQVVKAVKNTVFADIKILCKDDKTE